MQIPKAIYSITKAPFLVNLEKRWHNLMHNQRWQTGHHLGVIANHKTADELNLHLKEPRLITRGSPYTLSGGNQMCPIHSFTRCRHQIKSVESHGWIPEWRWSAQTGVWESSGKRQKLLFESEVNFKQYARVALRTVITTHAFRCPRKENESSFAFSAMWRLAYRVTPAHCLKEREKMHRKKELCRPTC